MKMSKRNWPRINRRNNHVKALIRPTLAITWPLGVISEEGVLTEAAQVYGDVRMT
jgi:hypothetical protein